MRTKRDEERKEAQEMRKATRVFVGGGSGEMENKPFFAKTSGGIAPDKTTTGQ